MNLKIELQKLSNLNSREKIAEKNGQSLRDLSDNTCITGVPERRESV